MFQVRQACQLLKMLVHHVCFSDYPLWFGNPKDPGVSLGSLSYEIVGMGWEYPWILGEYHSGFCLGSWRSALKKRFFSCFSWCYWSWAGKNPKFWHWAFNPIGSMYGIFTCIYHKNQPNVGKYTIHGSYGNILSKSSKHHYDQVHPGRLTAGSPTAITHEKKGKRSEPKLHEDMFQLLIFRGVNKTMFFFLEWFEAALEADTLLRHSWRPLRLDRTKADFVVLGREMEVQRSQVENIKVKKR